MRSGQALVLVMMVLSVALTVGLSIATRSTNEVKITSAQEESARALEAAEAGLEKALGGTLQTGGYPQPTLGSGAIYVVAPTPAVMGKIKEYIIPYQLVEGQIATVDLTHYVRDAADPDRLRIRFCWGTNGSLVQAALEAALYYEDAGKIKIGRLIYDPLFGNVNRFATSSLPGGSFTGQLNKCPKDFKYTKLADFSSFGPNVVNAIDNTKLKMLRLRLMFNGSNSEPVALETAGQGDFGRQGYEYTSVGSAGTSTQKIRAVDLNYDLPMMFDNAAFSGTSLNK